MDLPEYFDSQAQAAAMLGVSVYDVKSAKAAGCPAFRGGGRIRTKEVQAWLKENRAPSFSVDDGWPCVHVAVEWKDKSRRRDMLFGLIDYLEIALDEKQITAKQFCAIRDKTIPLVIKLGRAWNAGIDEPNYRKNYLGTKAGAKL